MQNLSALKELTQKLDEIKEAWQIYAIFEEARKNFNEEFDALKKDKEALIESYNTISAKNALLLAQNKELEAKNKTLKESNMALEKSDSNFKNNLQNNLENLESDVVESKDFSSLFEQYESLQEILKTIQEIFTKLPTALEPVAKLEVSYQKHQRLLANPAKDYVPLENAKELLNALINVESKLKTLDLELSKLHIEMRDLLQTPQELEKQEALQETSKEALEMDSIILDSTNNDKT